MFKKKILSSAVVLIFLIAACTGCQNNEGDVPEDSVGATAKKQISIEETTVCEEEIVFNSPEEALAADMIARFSNDNKYNKALCLGEGIAYKKFKENMIIYARELNCEDDFFMDLDAYDVYYSPNHSENINNDITGKYAYVVYLKPEKVMEALTNYYGITEQELIKAVHYESVDEYINCPVLLDTAEYKFENNPHEFSSQICFNVMLKRNEDGSYINKYIGNVTYMNDDAKDLAYNFGTAYIEKNQDIFANIVPPTTPSNWYSGIELMKTYNDNSYFDKYYFISPSLFGFTEADKVELPALEYNIEDEEKK